VAIVASARASLPLPLWPLLVDASHGCWALGLNGAGRAAAASGLGFAEAATAGFAELDDDLPIGPAAKDTTLPTATRAAD